jgi:hypothetical protein
MADAKDSAEPAGEESSTPTAQLEATPQGRVRRWLAELAMAATRDKPWCDESKEILRTYEAGKRKANSFNILWSNTDTLAPAVYNSTPVPDVRRRFRDEDPVGKAASLVIERTLAFELDQFDSEKIAKDATLDMLLVGRGVIRVKYEPVFDKMAEQAEQEAPLLDEVTPWEHVQWDDLRTGPGKRWVDKTWIAFRHDFTEDMAIEKFGRKIASKLQYLESDHIPDSAEKDTRQAFKTVEAWEIWDKEERRCLFIAECYKEAPCLEIPDPLRLVGFWPMPRPAYAVENSTSTVPIPLYRLYKEQALELDRVSSRINKIVDALKVRGAYLGNNTDLEKVIEAGDNQMIPVENVSGMADMGGLDKSIWIMPIDKLINVLNGLYVARNEIKATIYEISGISDIVRGSTQASESATAQRLKSEWGSMRLQKMQKEIQRLLRDCMRIQAEIYAQMYSQQRFAQITGVKLPTQQEKMQIQAQMQMQQQQMAMQPPMPGQPPPQPDPMMMDILKKPSWEEVMASLQNDGMRASKIDIETDSTIAETLDRDMRGLAEITEAIGQLIAGAAPAVQSGMLPVEVVKEFAMTIARRARMGQSVEDAMEKMQAPPPMQQVDPEQQKQMEAGKAEIEKGREEINAGKMDVAAQQNDMLKQQLQFVTQQAKQAMGEAEKSKMRASEFEERGPPDQVFQTLLEQLMAAQQQTQAIVQQSVEAINAALSMSAQTQQATAQAVMQSVQQNAVVMSQAVEAVTAPRQVTVQLPSGKTASATSSIKH